MSISVPGANAAIDAARGVGQHAPSAPEPAHEQHGLDDQPRRVTLVHVQPPWRHTTGMPSRVPSTRRPRCPGADAAGQPGSSANGIATASSRSSARPPSPEPSTMPSCGNEPVGARQRARARRAVRRTERRRAVIVGRILSERTARHENARRSHSISPVCLDVISASEVLAAPPGKTKVIGAITAGQRSYPRISTPTPDRPQIHCGDVDNSVEHVGLQRPCPGRETKPVRRPEGRQARRS